MGLSFRASKGTLDVNISAQRLSCHKCNPYQLLVAKSSFKTKKNNSSAEINQFSSALMITRTPYHSFLGINSLAAFGVIIQKLFNEIHVRQHHSSAAVALQSQFIQGITVGLVLFNRFHIRENATFFWFKN